MWPPVCARVAFLARLVCGVKECRLGGSPAIVPRGVTGAANDPLSPTTKDSMALSIQSYTVIMPVCPPTRCPCSIAARHDLPTCNV